MSYTKGTWNTSEQIRDHKLACSIINLHGTEDCVFDDEGLQDLKSFTQHRSVSARDDILKSKGYLDDEDSTRPGETAARHGCLSSYVIARYKTADEAFDEKDWELLEKWFEKGMPTGEKVSR